MTSLERQKKKHVANMKIALIVAELSSCRRHHVGAVLVRSDRILATGRNGARPGMPHCEDLMASGELAYADHKAWSRENEAHAEENALGFANSYGLPVKGSTMYITHAPCLPCAKLIVRNDVKEVIYLNAYKERPEDEEPDRFLEERGVKAWTLSLSDLELPDRRKAWTDMGSGRPMGRKADNKP